MEPRPVTMELLVEFFAWLRTAPMFTSSPEGRAFGEELREVFNLAAEKLEDGWGGEGVMDAIKVLPMTQASNSEREVFRYQATDGRSIRVIMYGPVDESAIEAIEAFISHRRSEAHGELVS